MQVYRAFRQDDVDVKENIRKNGKFQKPVLATGGDKSAFTKVSLVIPTYLAIIIRGFR